MNDLIKKLQNKNYVRAFGLMSPEEQECLRKAKGNCLVYQGQTGIQPLWTSGDGFNNTDTYAIKPDYQPEPEYNDVEICIGDDEILGVWDTKAPKWLHLHCLPSLPNFERFWFSIEKLSGEITVPPQSVSTRISQGEKVFARFRVP